MPTFSLAAVPGLAGEIEIDEGERDLAAAITITDPQLGLPPGELVSVLVSHEPVPATGGHLLTVETVDPVALIGGQLLLHGLTVAATFVDGTGLLTDLDPAEPVLVDGRVTWPGATALGFAAPVELTLSLSQAAGFVLTLADTPLPLPTLGGSAPLVTLNDGEVEIRAFPDAGEIAIGVEGSAALTPAGADQAGELLALLSRNPAPPAPVGFRLERRLRLGPSGLAVGDGLASSFRLDLATVVPDLDALGALPAGIALDLGLPSLDLTRTDAGALPNSWTLHLRGCDLRFPGFEALTGVRLRGDLRFDVPSALVFRPSAGGGIALPPALAWLAELLSWSPDGIALDDLADVVAASPGEVAWEETLREALPSDFDLGQLLAVIGPALATSGLVLESFFATLFRALSGYPAPQRGLAWAGWFSDLVPAADREVLLPDLLRTIGRGDGSTFRDTVAALFDADLAVDIGTLFDGLAEMVALDPTPAMRTLWTRFLGGALDGARDLRLPDIAAALRAMMGATSGPLAQRWLGPEAPAMPAGQFLAADALAGLALPSATWLTSMRGVEGMVPAAESPEPGSSRSWRLVRQAFAGTVTPELVAAARHTGFAVALIAAALAGCILRNPTPWFRLAGTDVGRLAPDDPRKALHLFAPGDTITPLDGNAPPDSWNGRYLIVSDIHRDRGAGDDEGPFQFGSIDHFAANRTLYAELLQRMIDEGYILIEAGDCEELWFVKDPDEHPSPPELMRQIIEANTGGDTEAAPADVYGRLRTLHEAGRYFRIYGNHDSYLREQPVHDELAAALGPIEVYDFLIVPGVKTMGEKGFVDLIADSWASLSSGNFDALAKGRLGMDSGDYTTTKPMLICHGHQFDFWNCDENRVLGELIANAVGVPADQAMDPFLDLRGVAYEGNPLFEFEDFFATRPVLDSWLGPGPARVFAHEVQHRPNKERLLHNGYMYQESMAAFVGNALMPLGEPQQHSGPAGWWNTYWSNHGNHLCIGHTHNPQSQPYFGLDPQFEVGGPVALLVRNLVLAALGISNDATPGPALLKSRYFNSGTCGWHEGVLWGIEIDEVGQARSVMLTADSRRLEYMDWELGPPRPDDYLAQLKKIAATILEALRKSLPDIGALRTRLEDALADFATLVVPIEAMGAGADADRPFTPGSRAGVDVTGARSVVVDGTGVLDDAAAATERFAAGFLGLLGRLQMVLQGALTAAETIVFDVEVTAAVRDQLRAIAEQLLADHNDLADENNVWYAATALRLGMDRLPLLRAGTLVDDPEPLFAAAASAMLMLPTPGRPVALGGSGAAEAFLASAVTLQDTRLRIAVTVGPGAPPIV